MDEKMTGHCLCGAVTITIPAHHEVGVCHCGMCRRWGGGPFFAIHCKEGVEFSGEENIARFASSDWADRGFCRECGTHLFYFLALNGEYAVLAGLFDDDENFAITEQIFIDRKPAFYSLANETHNLTAAEVMARFSADED